MNIDLKSNDPEYYRRVLGGDMETVKSFISLASEKCWTEVTTLVVPGDNDNPDDIRETAKWISNETKCGSGTPLHLSAYHPAHNYSRPATDADELERLGEIAGEYLDFVYLGNVGRENPTRCPECGTQVIERNGYRTVFRLKGGLCPECGSAIPGRFPE